MERGHNVKMICKQILKAQELSRNDLFEREKPLSEQKLHSALSIIHLFKMLEL